MRSLSIVNQQTYIDVISGKQSGIIAASLRALLAGVGLGYKAVMRLRNGLYDWSLKKSHKVDATVISVGNLTTGGTGKTPVVIWLCRYLHEQKRPCAILTRGYKATQDMSTTAHDEIAEFQTFCAHIPVIMNPDRLAGAQTAIHRHHVSILIMDDGFQHRRLARDLDIVTVDATLPFGFGRVFPAGLLREPFKGICRAQAVVLTRCDQVDEKRLHTIESQILDLHGDVVLCRSVHRPHALIKAQESTLDIEDLRGKRVFAACGIARPRAFIETLQGLGAHVVDHDITNDHHHYTQADVDRIARRAHQMRADICIFTQKNWPGVRQCSPPQDIPLACVQIRIEFLSGRDALIQLIDQTLESTISPTT
jgi:tetraacyldisaccharide 4'-kinase